MNLGYGLFMAEAEGLLNTHQSKVNRAVKDAGIMAFDSLDEVCDYYKLDLSALTSLEKERLNKAYNL